MRWSIEELIKAWRYQYGFHFKWWRKIFFGWGSLWRSFKATIHWIFKGYTLEMLWNMDHYFMEVIIMKVKHFRNSRRSGYPSDLNSQEEWDAILDEIIDKFTKMKDTYYEEMLLDSEIYTVPSETEGFRTVKFIHQKDDEIIRNMCYKGQRQNDEEAIDLFVKYFWAFWD
jgi:hypothetical protein